MCSGVADKLCVILQLELLNGFRAILNSILNWISWTTCPLHNSYKASFGRMSSFVMCLPKTLQIIVMKQLAYCQEATCVVFYVLRGIRQGFGELLSGINQAFASLVLLLSKWCTEGTVFSCRNHEPSCITKGSEYPKKKIDAINLEKMHTDMDFATKLILKPKTIPSLYPEDTASTILTCK